MATRLVFDVKALADVLKRASRVAPTSGEAFEKAAGIVFDIQKDVVVVKATDLVTEFAAWVTPHEISGDPIKWRISSRLFPDVIGKLKTIRQPLVALEGEGQRLRMTHGTARAEFGLMDPRKYPDWIPFSPDDMHSAQGLPEIAARVQRAASKKENIPLTGVHFDGQNCLATDRYRVACMPLPLKTPTPFTVPAGVLDTALPRDVPVLYRAEAGKLHLMPDERTQISIRMYGLDFPPVQRLMRREYPYMVKVDRARLLEMMELADTMTGGDKEPVMVLFLGLETVAVMMQNSGSSHLGDVLEVSGQAIHPRIELGFNPAYLMGAVDNALSSEIVLGYNPATPTAPMYVDGGGIEFWVMPLSPQAVAARSGAG